EADLIVAVYPPACRALGQLRASGQLQTPVWGYLTDPAPNFLWVHPALDEHLTVGEHTALEVTARYAVPAEAAGPLVGPQFRTVERTSAREEVRTSLGVAREDTLALLLLGSLGIGGVHRAARSLAKAGIHPVVLCARNAKLQRRLSKLPGVTALGWRTDVDRLICASDVVVHNAGGLCLTEALVVGVPAVTFAAIPGHGKANARSLDESGTAPWARNRTELVRQVARLGRERHVPWSVGRETAVRRICAELQTRPELTVDLTEVHTA
ncbi:MAG: processive 1,2-diacylglycerol beta-glucosyltransferase, partial [Frankiales bacterium]|nr:processive 1,2-diacylglycerol beta-glucosyltransferase [Frankiales bacterium]